MLILANIFAICRLVHCKFSMYSAILHSFTLVFANIFIWSYLLLFCKFAVEHIRKFFRAKKKPQTCCGFVYFQRSCRALQITVPFQASVAPLAVAFLLCWFHLSHCLRGSVLPCTPQNLQATKFPILSQIRRV